MRTYDLTPLLRSGIGFDRLDRVFNDLARQNGATSAYPPYDIVKTGENGYRITMAIAGFGEDDLDLTVTDGVLVIKGAGSDQDQAARYLHRGIARRGFERRFQLADNVEVAAARLENGLLHVELAHEVPEHLKPRRIPIDHAPTARAA